MKERKRNYGVCVFQIVVKCERSKLVLPNIRATKQDHNLDPIKYHPPTHPPYHKPYACLPPFLPKRDPPPSRALARYRLVGPFARERDMRFFYSIPTFRLALHYFSPHIWNNIKQNQLPFQISHQTPTGTNFIDRTRPSVIIVVCLVRSVDMMMMTMGRHLHPLSRSSKAWS